MDQLTFDSLLENRIGFGKFQITQFLIICFVDFLDGAEFIYTQFLAPLLKNEWNVSVLELSAFAGLFNFGIMIGTAICGVFADQVGRKTILVLGCILQFLTVFATVYAQNMLQMIFLRTIYGIVIGMNLPISQILMTEVTPPHNRGKTVLMLQVAMVLGRQWIFLLAYVFMDSLSYGNWRAMALFNSIPCLICLIGTIIFIKESPRFQICQGKMDEGVQRLNEIGHLNNDNYANLEENEINQLNEWRIHTYQEIKPGFLELFNSETIKVTWRNYSISFLFLFILIANLAIMTFLFEAESRTIFHFWIVELADIPAIFCMMICIDNFGRKNLLLLSSFLNMISQFALYYNRLSVIMIALMIFKFLAIIGFATSCILFAESYNTLHRSIGLGSTMAFGRIGATVSPFIIYPLFYQDNYLPFFVTGIAFLIMLIIVFFYPLDLTNKPLDVKEERIKQS